MPSDMYANYTVPGLELEAGHKVADALQMRIHALNDLALTLKHAHWNVVGRDFISVHEMLDPQIDLVRAMIDALAERMATLGVSPNGLPGDLTEKRTWHDYPIGRATTSEHLAALDVVYNGVLSDHRAAIATVGPIDPITEDILISQTGQLELFQWFMRSHLENPSGELLTENIESAKEAAAAARRVN